MDSDTTTIITSPQSPPNPNPNPNPNLNLRPTKSTAFKREERRKRKERKRQEKLAETLCNWDPLSSNQSRPSDQTDSTVPVSDIPWPCEPDPPLSNRHDSSDWGTFVQVQPCAPQKATPSSPHVVTVDVQTSALRKYRSFFKVEEEVNGDCSDEAGAGNERVFGFFSDLFQSNEGLRRFYEERRDKGVLVCLVCEKKFGSCISLVHHASTVSKTRRKQAHRFYGAAMSQVLGLEANQVPVLGSNKGDASDSEEEFAEYNWEEMEI